MRLAAAGIVEANIPDGIFDPTAWIEGGYCPGCGLDLMHLPYSYFSGAHDPSEHVSVLLARIDPTSGTFSAYGDGTIICVGPLSGKDFRFGRLVVYRGPDGTILHGTAPNRFIEIQISLGYRGVPFA
jgi:hypothetical protein